eukprot:30717-Pelagococcus_subviridis.AAC.7
MSWLDAEGNIFAIARESSRRSSAPSLSRSNASKTSRRRRFSVFRYRSNAANKSFEPPPPVASPDAFSFPDPPAPRALIGTIARPVGSRIPTARGQPPFDPSTYATPVPRSTRNDFPSTVTASRDQSSACARSPVFVFVLAIGEGVGFDDDRVDESRDG